MAVLTAQQRRFVDKLVKSRRYADRDAALRAGVQLLEDVERQREAERAELRALIDPALEDFERGDYYTLDEAFAHAFRAIGDVKSELTEHHDRPAKRRRAG